MIYPRLLWSAGILLQLSCSDPRVIESSHACNLPSSSCPASDDAVRPERLSEHTAVYANERAEMLMFGGMSEVPPPPGCGFPEYRYKSELWIFDDACDAWREVDADGPSPRRRHVASYAAGKMWVFGGRFDKTPEATGEYTLYNDLWAFDPIDEEWQELDPKGTPPSPRANAGMIWDDERERLWVFGGVETDLTPLNDLYSYDIQANRWREHSPPEDAKSGTNIPEPRYWHGMLYDQRRDEIVVFGGGLSSQSYLSDLWTIDLDSVDEGEPKWFKLADSSTDADALSDNRPRIRFWPRLFHDTEQDTYVLFGGHDNTFTGNLNDVWSFDPVEEEWDRTRRGDVENSVPNGPCDLPPDYVKLDIDSPERRSAHTLVWSTACQHALLVGGKSPCGALDDVWEYADAQWNRRQRASVGETCFRRRDELGTDSCKSLCF